MQQVYNQTFLFQQCDFIIYILHTYHVITSDHLYMSGRTQRLIDAYLRPERTLKHKELSYAHQAGCQ